MKVPWIFSSFSFLVLVFHESFPTLILVFNFCQKKNSMIMISKGYAYVINLGIASNFYTSIGPVYPGSCTRGSIIVSKISGTWVLPSPQIPELIVCNKFWQGISRSSSINFLCFISTITVHFINSTIKVSKNYFVFVFIFIYHIIL